MQSSPNGVSQGWRICSSPPCCQARKEVFQLAGRIPRNRFLPRTFQHPVVPLSRLLPVPERLEAQSCACWNLPRTAEFLPSCNGALPKKALKRLGRLRAHRALPYSGVYAEVHLDYVPFLD